MDWDRVEGQWKELKGNIHEKWAELTADDIESIAGNKDLLRGKPQSYYGH